jgi:hypothetical protein
MDEVRVVKRGVRSHWSINDATLFVLDFTYFKHNTVFAFYLNEFIELASDMFPRFERTEWVLAVHALAYNGYFTRDQPGDTILFTPTEKLERRYLGVQ